MVNNLNPVIQGWRNYYGAVDPGMSRRFLHKVDWHISRRLILYWRKKHKRNKKTPTQIMEVFQSKGLKTVSGYERRYRAQGEEHRKAVCGKIACTV